MNKKLQICLSGLILIVTSLFCTPFSDALPIPTGVYGTVSPPHPGMYIVISAYENGTLNLVDQVNSSTFSAGRYAIPVSLEWGEVVDITGQVYSSGVSVLATQSAQNVDAGEDVNLNFNLGAPPVTEDSDRDGSPPGNATPSENLTDHEDPFDSDSEPDTEQPTGIDSDIPTSPGEPVSPEEPIPPHREVPFQNIIMEFVLYIVFLTIIVLLFLIYKKKKQEEEESE